jgi:alpha-mannosidase
MIRVMTAARVTAIAVTWLIAARAIAVAPATAPGADTCLIFAATNLAVGEGNFFVYCTFSEQRVKLAPGDALEYDVYLDPANPTGRGGIDLEFAGHQGRALRDTSATDQAGERAHPDADLTRHAIGKWYRRRIALDAVAGAGVRQWNVVFEGDRAGRYVQFIDNVAIAHADGRRTAVYENGAPAMRVERGREGYGQHVLLSSVSRNQVVDGKDLTRFITSTLETWNRRLRLEALRAEVETAGVIAKRANDPHLADHVAQARTALAKVESDVVTDEQLQAVLHEVNGALNHEHPEMRRYTGHLVGHAHIDFQWLWEWPETVQVCKQTFGQAVRFMEEFPEFKFSQSSSALYAATEEHFPELFKEIQKRVKSGQWELVGGRVCEADQHMISHESHARHFLYGQRYFRERFGKTAVVGWEPDTFGHTSQMPQILQLGGCRYYYFCRGGKKQPMFWWEAPDGSRVLAFEEPATGGWYNGDVTPRLFERAFDFESRLGLRDMLWVYGVGNHGGGPTRENLVQALDWMRKPYLPAVKFSTATEFFTTLEKNYDTGKLPVIRGELNTPDNHGFYGTYTAHSDIKRWNRDAEAVTESAEAIAAIAALYGFDYPRAEFRRNWEDICWNHHHDTLPGTSIHASYDLSERMYKRVIESSRKIAQAAQVHLADRVPRTGEETIVVFNSTGSRRNETLPMMPFGNAFFDCHVEDVPAFGYRVYDKAVLLRHARERARTTSTDDGTILENDDFRIELDPARGVLTSIFDKTNKRECIAPGGSGNRLEIHWEDPKGMSSWTIGPTLKVDGLEGPVKIERIGIDRIQWRRHFQKTAIVQSLHLPPVGPPEFSIATEWKELGGTDTPGPFLKVAFDVNVSPKDAKVTYQIPFGTIERPAGGNEHPALKFADITDADGSFGAAILNDCKHGYSARGNTLYLSLIRSSDDPDPRPNDRPQSARWVFLPHKGDWRVGGVLQAAEAFNHPLSATTVASNPSTTQPALPREQSFFAFDQPNVVITGLKRAEEDDSLIIRFYEAFGKRTTARLLTSFKVRHAHRVNFLEDEQDHVNTDRIELRPHQICTLSLTIDPVR